jgi:hypothetical protein
MTKKFCMYFLFTMQNGCLAHFTLLDLKNLKILGEEYKKRSVVPAKLLFILDKNSILQNVTILNYLYKIHAQSS